MQKALIDWTLSMLEGKLLSFRQGAYMIEGITLAVVPGHGRTLIKTTRSGAYRLGYADDIVIMVRGRYLDALWDQVIRGLRVM